MSSNKIPNIIIAGFTGDRSGSMSSLGNTPSNGLKNWIDEQKQSIKDNGQTGKMFVSCFDSNHIVRIDGENIEDVDVTIDECREWMRPDSMTRLYDSAISDIDRLVKAKQDYEKNMPRSLKNLDPEILVIWACLTDGHDNESESTVEDFRNKVKEARSLGIKCFFLGANQDAVMTGDRYGFDTNQCLTFGAAPEQSANALRSVTQVMREASAGSSNIGFTQLMRETSAPASFNNYINQTPPQVSPPFSMLRAPAHAPPMIPRC